MQKIRRDFLFLIISIFGSFATLYGIVLFNAHLLMTFDMSIRMFLVIVVYWSLLIIPMILMAVNKEHIKDLGFTTKKLFKQIVIGIIIAVSMSAILTVIPILLGFGDIIGSKNYTQAWQFIHDFIFSIFSIALVEEFLFRGYIFHKLLKIKNNRMFAIILSSVFFGFFHIFTGLSVQILTTAIIGFFFCICREKIKDCTILSLIIAHGLYNGLITLWIGIL